MDQNAITSRHLEVPNPTMLELVQSCRVQQAIEQALPGIERVYGENSAEALTMRALDRMLDDLYDSNTTADENQALVAFFDLERPRLASVAETFADTWAAKKAEAAAVATAAEDDDGGYPPPCTDPGGHVWVISEETDRSYCENCFADGDA